MKSKGWHSRGYLPHFDAPRTLQALTFRLADSVPQKVINRWKNNLAKLEPDEARAQLHRKIAAYEDTGYGCCLLHEPNFAHIVQSAFLHFDGERYQLLQWVIMPNHVHLLLKVEEEPLERIVKSWKSFTSRQMNLARKTTGPIWARDYHDRYIRDQEHYENARAFLRLNPVRAGLCKRPEDWAFSSAGYRG